MYFGCILEVAETTPQILNYKISPDNRIEQEKPSESHKEN